MTISMATEASREVSPLQEEKEEVRGPKEPDLYLDWTDLKIEIKVYGKVWALGIGQCLSVYQRLSKNRKR